MIVVLVSSAYSGFHSDASVLASPLTLSVAARAAESKSGGLAFDFAPRSLS
jgi:hypothetical protein